MPPIPIAFLKYAACAITALRVIDIIQVMLINLAFSGNQRHLMNNGFRFVTAGKVCLPSRRWLSNMLCGLIILCIHPALFADTLELDKLTQSPTPLTNYFTGLEDTTKKLTLDDIQSPEIGAQFSRIISLRNTANFGLTKAAYWLRLPLRNNTSEPIEAMLEIAYPNLSSIQFYTLKPHSPPTRIDTGNTLPFATRAYKNRHFVFPVSVPAHSGQLLYLRIESRGVIEIPAQLWTSNAFHAYERTDYARQAWYFGIVLALVAFNFLLFIILRDFSYLWYIIFATCTALTIAANKGLGLEFLWPNATGWNPYASMVGISITSAALIRFMRRLLNTKETIPKLDEWLRIITFIHMLVPIIILTDYQLGMRIALPTNIISIGLILFGGIVCSAHQQRSAIFFLASFGMPAIAFPAAILRALNFLPNNIFTTQGVQISSAVQMLMLAFALVDRFKLMNQERAKAQKETFEAQQRLVENLQSAEHLLEERVLRRTQALLKSNQALSLINQELNEAYKAAEMARSEAEQSQKQTIESSNQLRNAQIQLVQSEKMAALGQLIAGVAHEINTPMGAVKSSGQNIADTLTQSLTGMASLCQTLDAETLTLFLALIDYTQQPVTLLSSREERALTREIGLQLEQAGLRETRRKAGILVQLNAHNAVNNYLPLLRHPQHELIFDTASGIAIALQCTHNINTAVNRVFKIVFALKSFSHSDVRGEAVETDLSEGLETVLLIYQSQIKQNTELVREYEKIAPLHCWPDELNQIWTNLIHNALQAMSHKGTLTIRLRRINDEAVISIGDTGCGIPDTIRERIFDAFFTTKPIGEGSGLGLDIVKKIIDRHHGRIEVKSQVGVGTTFLVYLPYRSGSA